MALSLHYCAFFFKFIFELGGQRRNSERDDSNVWVVVGYACVRVTEQKGGGVGWGQHICIIWLLLKWHVFLKKRCSRRYFHPAEFLARTTQRQAVCVLMQLHGLAEVAR